MLTTDSTRDETAEHCKDHFFSVIELHYTTFCYSTSLTHSHEYVQFPVSYQSFTNKIGVSVEESGFKGMAGRRIADRLECLNRPPSLWDV